MAETYASRGRGISNVTASDNQAFGYPTAAGNPDDAQNHPNSVDVVGNGPGTVLTGPIITIPDAYTSYDIPTETGFTYDIDTDAGAGTGTVVTPAVPILGDDTSKIVVVQVDTVGTGSVFQVGVDIAVAINPGILPTGLFDMANSGVVSEEDDSLIVMHANRIYDTTKKWICNGFRNNTSYPTYETPIGGGSGSGSGSGGGAEGPAAAMWPTPFTIPISGLPIGTSYTSSKVLIKLSQVSTFSHIIIECYNATDSSPQLGVRLLNGGNYVADLYTYAFGDYDHTAFSSVNTNLYGSVLPVTTTTWIIPSSTFDTLLIRGSGGYPQGRPIIITRILLS